MRTGIVSQERKRGDGPFLFLLVDIARPFRDSYANERRGHTGVPPLRSALLPCQPGRYWIHRQPSRALHLMGRVAAAPLLRLPLRLWKHPQPGWAPPVAACLTASHEESTGLSEPSDAGRQAPAERCDRVGRSGPTCRPSFPDRAVSASSHGLSNRLLTQRLYRMRSLLETESLLVRVRLGRIRRG